MSTTGVIPTTSVGQNNQLINLGKPVTGNTGLPNPINNMGIIPNSAPPSNIGAHNGGIISGNPLTQTAAIPTAGFGTPVSSPATTIAGATPGASPSTPIVTKDEKNQLVDIYGKGTGNLIASEIGNLGSNDSSYMQAYDKAMAVQNAENLATLNTTLGNEGIGANSSTAAIENADFMSGVTSQEGFQEQQLQMNDLAQLLGLTESTEDASQKEVSSSVLGDIGDVLTAVGDVASGHGIPSMGRHNSAVPIADSSQAGLLDLSNASTAGLSPTDSVLSTML